jgi:hypothetical protein
MNRAFTLRSGIGTSLERRIYIERCCLRLSQSSRCAPVYQVNHIQNSCSGSSQFVTIRDYRRLSSGTAVRFKHCAAGIAVTVEGVPQYARGEL